MAQENLDQQVEELKAKCDEYLNGWKRERADFINYKKEEGERIGTLAKFANEELLLNVLPILDNLLLASAHIKDDGLSQVVKQFQDFLIKEGIEPIEVTDKNFDPNTMDAVEGEGEKVSEELQKGYTLHGKLIRPARVKLTK
ncbi:MAG TPA: nucleotide exchange factor GrpE [Candidatus Staskawiczbacteria bacterium]|nr:nucleotide exchange factor GrpE [Candidatus Staskawiczbacteria bacterium]